MQLTMTERFLDEVFNDFMALRQEWTDQGADNKYTSSRRAGAGPGLARLLVTEAAADIGEQDTASRQDSCRAPGGRPMG